MILDHNFTDLVQLCPRYGGAFAFQVEVVKKIEAGGDAQVCRYRVLESWKG